MSETLPSDGNTSFLTKLKQPKVFIPLGIFIILYVALNIFVFRYSQEEAGKKFFANIAKRFQKREKNLITAPVPTPMPTPTPYPIAQGKQEYNVNTNSKTGPKINKVTIDPLDTKMNEPQTISAVVKSTSAVSGVMVALRTDNNVITNHQLALTSGTATDGVWSASWKTEVVHDYLYQVIVTATDAETSSSVTVTIR